MDDAEVTRQALGISFSSWARLEDAVKAAKSDGEALLLYVDQCPFVSSDSPALKSAMRILQRAPTGKRTTLTGTNKRIKASETTLDATRVAMRITMSSWSQLQVQGETLNDFEVLRRYIRQCPFVHDNSETKNFILESLLKASTGNPPPLDGVESDSEESVEKKIDTNATKIKEQQHTTTSETIHALKQLNFGPFLVLIRSIFLDLPMLVLFATYLGLCWTHRVDRLYIQPSMKAALWTDDRAYNEITYYHRHCTAEDITTKSANDLLVPENATVQEAYEHQLLHGFSIFQGVLTDDVMHDLRTYVVARNRKLTAEESIFVIEGDKRYSFGLGTEEPSVARAVKQLATHHKLAPALEKILGPNPALIEMTAITSSYGAVNQYWHDDVIAPASAMKYGRSFGPSYSVFIQLQNTTRAMGATDACPGSHRCSAGNMEEFCDAQGFQAVNGDTGYWKAGDALLMNMNSYHRGTAHTDPQAPDRVMLILTFVPKPKEKAESRQLSQGITFSLRWDMWGHTLWDLAKPDTRMTQPWVTLRALGLYKPKDAAWGVDYVSSATMRMANGDNGFRRDELDTFLARGGFHWLPQFLHGQVKDNENWHEFLVDTLERCLEFIGYVNIAAVSLYGFCLFALFFMLPSQQFGLRGICLYVARLSSWYAVVLVMWLAANHHVDNSGWAKDIRVGHRYTVDFTAEEMTAPNMGHLPSTLPHRNDVLIETRYGSRQLHMYNDFTNFHPGSRAFRDLAKVYSFAYSQVQSEFFQNATAAHVVDEIEFSQGRFLLQKGNEWLWLSRDDAVAFVKTELAVESRPLLKYMMQEIRFLESEYKYGTLRNTSLAFKSVQALGALKNRILRNAHAIDPWTGETLVRPVDTTNVAASFSLLRQKLAIPFTRRCVSRPVRPSRLVVNDKEPTEPEPGAWIKSGDFVEGTEFLENGECHWYPGSLHKVTASGEFYIAYADSGYGILASNLVRAYQPYYVGEELEVLMGDDAVEDATIIVDHGDGTYDLVLKEENELLRRVPIGDLRRLREDHVDEQREAKNHYL